MYLGIFLVLGIFVCPLIAGTVPENKQLSLLKVLQPKYYLNDNARLGAFSEALDLLGEGSDGVFSDALQNLQSAVKHGGHYSGYVQSQLKEMTEIAELLLNARDFDSSIYRASVLRRFVNPTTYNFALKKAFLIRKDTADLWYPPLWQINSRSFFTEETISHAIEQTRTKTSNIGIEKFSTGTYADPEYRIAWFREDIGLNEMHAKIAAVHIFPDSDIDVFHLFTQILARYDAERFAVDLPRVAALLWFASSEVKTIAEGYDPHLATNLGEKRFAARPANMRKDKGNLRDPDNPQTDEHFTYLFHKIVDNIRTGFMTNEKGEYEPMTREALDDMIRGTSKNTRLYTEQGIHRLGHEMLSVVTDPDGRYQQEIGVMGAHETAMRDPLFYRYHRYITDLYDMYQYSLPAYSESDFDFSGIRVDDVQVQCSVNFQKGNPRKGALLTFMEKTEAHIMYDPTIDSPSKDSQNSLKIPYERLNHHDFEYTINVHNDNPNGDNVQAVVRIFIAPHNDDTKMPFKSVNEQRNFFIEMDKFVTTLKKGDNVLKRSSVMSSVSFPSVDTFEQWRDFRTTYGLRHDRLTGCGWPYHLLLPRGTAEGMDFDLFVMLTDWEKDRAESIDPNTIPDLDFGSCLCGMKAGAYPDNKSRGFPFDRKFRMNGDLADFAQYFNNVFVGNVKIFHEK